MRNLLWHRPELIGIPVIGDGDKAQYGPPSNTLLRYEVDKLKDVHRLDDMFNNSRVLDQFLFYDLWYIMQRHCVPEKDLGPSYGKNASRRTMIHFDKTTSSVYITGTKTYSRRSESKERIYPCQWIAKRLQWFLRQSQYVESYDVDIKSPMNISIEIKFKSCYSDARKNTILKRHALSERNRLQIQEAMLKFAIENYDTLDNLKARLVKVQNAVEKKQREFHEIKI
ncbi:hypothetical protein [Citrobacter phage Ci1]|nr:hypothetical protein [Citrobacter phage Ci1]